MSKQQCYTLREVLAELFVDDNSNFYLDVADSSSYSNEQVCETGWHCSVEMTETFFRLFDVENTVVTLQILIFSSFSNC